MEYIKIKDCPYLIIRQSNGEIKYSSTIAGIANFLSSTPAMIKLHLNHEVQLNGWEVKSNSKYESQ